MSKKLDEELLANLAVLTVQVDRLYQQLFWRYAKSEAEDIIADMVRTVRDLNTAISRINAQLSKIANDAVTESILAVISEMREQ